MSKIIKHILAFLFFCSSGIVCAQSSTVLLRQDQIQLPIAAIPVDVGVMYYSGRIQPHLLVPAQGTNTLYTFANRSPQVFAQLVQQYAVTQPLSLVPTRLNSLTGLEQDFVLLTQDGNVTPWRYNGASFVAGTPVALRQGLACAATDRLVTGRYQYGFGGADLACWSNGLQPGFSRAKNMGNGVFQALARIPSAGVTATTMTTAPLYPDQSNASYRIEDALVPMIDAYSQFSIWPHSHTASPASWQSATADYPRTATRYCATVAAADVNGDGIGDVVTGGKGLSVHLGRQGFLSYNVASPDTFALSSLAPLKEVRLADLNGDNRPEMLTLSTDGVFSVYENTSRTSVALFNPLPTLYLPGLDPAIIRVADADADGDLDVLIPCRGDHSIAIFWNDRSALATAAPVPLTVDVYPNPAENSLRLQWPMTGPAPQTVALLDMMGRTARQWKAPERDATLEVADLPRGTYLLRLTSKAPTVTRRIILQ